MRNLMKKKQSGITFSSFVDTRSSLSDEEQIIEAGKVITEIENVDVDRATRLVMHRIQKRKTISLIIHHFKNAAAILLISLLLFSVWSTFKTLTDSTKSAVAMQEITSPMGVRTKIDLPDSTRVWLNAGSTLKFPVRFENNERNVELIGEAFFEVYKNKKSPFTVLSNKAKVKVLGTSFNFRSYHTDAEIEVVLKEGQVLFEAEYGNNKTQQLMYAGTRLEADKQTGKIGFSEVHVNKYIAWHDDKLVFDESPINELAKKLERWYGVKVVVEDNKQLQNYRFTTTFENEPLQQVLELLELSSPISIRYVAAKYDSNTNAFTKSQVIIRAK